MEFIVIFFFELVILFLLSRTLQRRLSYFLFLVTKSTRVTVYLLAILFLPGTIIHETAHFLMAKILLVPVGKMELIPKLEGDSVKLGSVAIARSDPFRRLLIGIAPFLVGTVLIVVSLFFAEQHMLWRTSWAVAVLFYILFEIGNSMFSSKKDLEGAAFTIIFFIVVIAVLYFFGLRITVDQLQYILTDSTVHVFSQGAVYLLFPIIIDLLLIIILTISNRLLGRS